MERKARAKPGDWNCACVVVDVAVNGGYVEITTKTTVDCKVTT